MYVCVRSLFCNAVLSVLGLAIIRELVVLLVLSIWCRVAVIVLCRFLTVPWVGLQCVIVAFLCQLTYFIKMYTFTDHIILVRKQHWKYGSVWHKHDTWTK